MNEPKVHILTLMLIILVSVLLVTVIGLYVKVNNLQREMLGISTLPQFSTESVGLELGVMAPFWTLTDIYGETISLQDFTKENVLLVFFSPQCPACIEMIPTIKNISENIDMQMVMISNGSIEENQRLVTEAELDFPVLSWEDRIAQDYKIPGTPFFYVINSDFEIINAGFFTSSDLLLEISNVKK